MDKKKDLIKNTLIIGLGKVSTQLISFLLLPLYTFFLSPSEFGTVDLIITYITLLAPAITLQLEMASFRFLVDARNDENEKKRIISNVIWTTLVILASCAVLFLVVNLFMVIPYSGFILLSLCATIFSNLFLQFARGMGDNKKFAIASIMTGLTTLVATLALIVLAGMGAEGMLLSIALANIVCSTYLFFALKINRYIGFGHYNKPLQKELIAYSFPLVPNGVSWWVINVSDRTIISIVIGVAANGIYAVANKYAAIFSSIFAIFSMSWTESASVYINDKDRDSFFSETFNASIRLFGSLGLGLIIVIPILFPLMVGPTYNEAYLYIPILIIGAFFNAIVGLYSAIYVAKKLTKQVAATSLVAAAINISLTLIFIHFFGLYAAAAATAIAYSAMAIYRHHDIKKYVKITYEKGLFTKIVLLYIVAISFYYFNNVIGNIISAAAITIVILILNKSVIRVIKNKVMSVAGRKRKLTPEQDAYENSI